MASNVERVIQCQNIQGSPHAQATVGYSADTHEFQADTQQKMVHRKKESQLKEKKFE